LTVHLAGDLTLKTEVIIPHRAKASQMLCPKRLGPENISSLCRRGNMERRGNTGGTRP
jgi:hypothetical protein